MSVYSVAETLKDPLVSNYLQLKTEDNCFHSRWLYGNHTAYFITSLRNSTLVQKAYTSDGEVQGQGYRALYGISLIASTFFGLVLDVIHNFLAIASIYFLGKRIWEYCKNEGPFASSINTSQEGISQRQISVKNNSSKSEPDSAEQCSRMEDINGHEIVIKLKPLKRTPSPPLPDASKPFNVRS